MNRRAFVKTGILAGGGLATADKGLLAIGATSPSVPELLNQGMIWCHESVWVPLTESARNTDCHAVFIREIQVNNGLAAASVYLFCFTRYRLYVNGLVSSLCPGR